jgi:hypothetical protein
MADQLKEIYNNTVYIGQLTNGVPVATTDATTQLVIKDVQVSNNAVYSSLGITPTLSVNNSLTASLASSVTGSEIIDVSSSAIVSVPAITFNSLSYSKWISATGAGSVTTTVSRLANSAVSSSLDTYSSSAAATGYTPVKDFFFVNSNFYFTYEDGNSSTYLVRRSGGPTTADSVVSSSVYQPWVRGGTDKFHSVVSNSVRTYSDTTNNFTNSSTITHANWGSTTSSYPRAAFANGLVFYSNDSYSQNICWAINPTTGIAAYISTSWPVSWTSNTFFDVCFVGGFYYLVKSTTAAGSSVFYTAKVEDFGALTSSNINVSAVSSINTGYTAGNTTFNNAYKLDKATGDLYYIVSVSGNTYTYGVTNIITGATKPNLVVTMGSSNMNHNSIANPSNVDDSANKLNTTFYPTSMRLRITGVQSTL